MKLCDPNRRLFEAAVAGDVNRARAAIGDGADVDSTFTLAVATPLQQAARCGHPSVVRLLVESGADVNAEDIVGQTALHAAVSSGCVEVVTLLLESGAQVDVRDVEGRFPLHDLTANPSEILAVLLLHGASADCRDMRQNTVLHCASENEDTPLVAQLLRSGADPFAINADDERPIDLVPGGNAMLRGVLQEAMDRSEEFSPSTKRA